MNPLILNLISGIVNILPGAVNTVGSLFKNKKSANPTTATIMPALMKDKHSIASGLELSSKIVAGYGIGGVLIYYAIEHEPVNIYILLAGAALVAITTIAKVFERKDG